MRIIVEDKNISDIPVLKVYDFDCQKIFPVVLMLHGYGGKKEDILETAYRIAKEGFCAIAFDAYYHGGLKGKEIENPQSYLALKPGIVFDIFRETSKSIGRLLDACEDDHQTDSHRTGLMGISMGGNIIFDYISKGGKPRVKASVLILSSPVWSTVFKNFWTNQGMGDYLSEAEMTYLESIQPSNTLGNIRDVPLLLLNGDSDGIIAIKDVRDSYAELEKNYANKNVLNLIEYKGVGHQVTADMIDQACCWFRKFV
ncbi:MAG: alpha/beta hydrolase [Deltaproteobacteria bacterium]|nr:alpha/beta hydrolase [Deltaproteobacteria bacterium]